MTRTKILRRVVQYAPRIISQWARYNGRCVLATRVGYDVLRACGIEAEPIAVIIDVANAPYFAWAAHGGTRDEFRASGCWLISNDPVTPMDELPPQVPRPPRGTNQHLVLHVPAVAALVDLDLRQMARPQHQILPPDAIMLPWDGAETGQAWGWGAVRYRPWPADVVAPDWRAVKDWRGPHAGVTDALIRAVRKGRDR